MHEIKWDDVFDEQIDRRDGATQTEIEKFVATVQQPISEAELEWLTADFKDDHPEGWIVPDAPLPASYLSFLRWSNGGEFRSGERLMQFFPSLDTVHGVRAMMLAYGLPGKSPGILPFAFNGGGVFYAFDMRFRPCEGEYRIVAAECGYSHKPSELEPTFLAACRSRTDFEEIWDEEDEITRPICEECGEFLVCPECGKRGHVRH